MTETTLTLPKNYASYKDAVDTTLTRLSYAAYPDARQEIQQAIEYSLFAKGKRIRPVLMLMSYALFKKDTVPILPAACALECIHTYSLIHDDLPAMDNDDYRRGQLTSHKKFGEDMAILAGDALQTLAFSWMSTHLTEYFRPEAILSAIQVLADASGINGMIGGQVLDIKGHLSQQDAAYLEHLHHKKTGALITASLTIPSILLQRCAQDIDTLRHLGHHLGLLFQVVDDILDVTGTQESLGKTANKDVEQQKLTYISLFGLERATQIADTLLQECCQTLNKIPADFLEKKTDLEHLFRYIRYRSH